MTSMRRSCRAALTAVAMASATLLATAGVQLAGTPVAHAASSVGGTITRSEVIERAEYWYARDVPYSQNATYPDPQGKRYRTDCSGFVSMTWHLDTTGTWLDGGYNTAQFGTWSGKTYIAWSDLKPGDAILGVSYGHMALFHKWADAAHTTVWVYQESNPTDDMKHSSISISWYKANDFRPIR